MPPVPTRARRLLTMAGMIIFSLLFIVPGAVLLAQGPQTIYLPRISKEITPTPTATQIVDLGWEIHYYNNTDLSGSAVFSTFENTPFVEKEWGEGGPGSGVNNDFYSASFSRRIWFDPATYQFLLTVDDGGRMYIDGQLVIDAWQGSPRGTHSGAHTRTFTTGGWHTIRVEYVEFFQTARVRAWWLNTTQVPGWRAEYYNTETLSGTPAVVRNEDHLTIDWVNGAPSGIQSDFWSARFTRAFFLSDYGSYVFSLMADDGGQVWIDRWAPGQASIDKFSGASGQTTAVHEILPPGWYVITVTFHEVTGGAKIDFRQNFGGTFNEHGYRAKYWNNETLTGDPVWQQDDFLASSTKDTQGRMTSERLAFDWGSGAPTLRPFNGNTNPPTLPSNYFSVRWTHAFNGLAGKYRFTVRADDGFRLWVDGVLVRDAWFNETGRTLTNDIDLFGDWHTIRLEFREAFDNAYIDFSWVRL